MKDLEFLGEDRRRWQGSEDETCRRSTSVPQSPSKLVGNILAITVPQQNGWDVQIRQDTEHVI